MNVPLPIAILPFGIYGVSFDLRTRRMRDPLPNGWEMRNGYTNVYRRIRTFFESRLYVHAQSSVYQRLVPGTTALMVWHDMWDLRAIAPVGIVPSVIGELQMFHINHPAMVVTDEMRLGGQHAPYAFGPTPVGLFPPGLNHVQPGAAPPAPWPVGVVHSATSNDPSNWAI